jgi:hypothetical protein
MNNKLTHDKCQSFQSEIDREQLMIIFNEYEQFKKERGSDE